MNSSIFVYEGSALEFTISAEDPDGDPLTCWVEDAPLWASFDPNTGIFHGTAPLWDADYATRKDQPGIFDVTFKVTDGTYTVSKTITIHLLDSGWTPRTMAELVANRPIVSGGDIGTPVQLSNVSDDTVWTDFGGGKYLRRISFGFTSQVPDIPGWEEDWVSTDNHAYLPMDTPVGQNIGAVVEGSYAEDFGETEFAKRACAELDIPVLIIDRGWPIEHGGDLMGKYHDKAVETRDPGYLFYVFSTAHYLRAVDALVTVIDSMTTWPVSYADFRVVFTGHSKFGITCFTAAAADPDRVTGFMTSGSPCLDTGACRLLGRLQGANSTKPDAHPNYLGSMMRYYVEPLAVQDEIDPDAKAMLTQGTNDDKDRTEGYTPKYLLDVSGNEIDLFSRIGCVPNLPHTTQSIQHSTYWRMWLARCFLGRDVSSIDTVHHHPDGGNITVRAVVSGVPSIQQVHLWATDQNDMDTGTWDNFTSYPMVLDGGSYRGVIPGNATAYYIEVVDEQAGVTGLISTAPSPVNRDYPLLQLSPSPIVDFQAQLDNQTIRLDWTNPADEDFAGVLIVSSTSGYPSNPLDGVLVYDGADTSYAYQAPSESTYCFTAFAYDTTGCYSTGATAIIEGSTSAGSEPDCPLPRRFGLSQNFPNPFNPETSIGYTMEKDGPVVLEVYNIRGQKIRTIVDGEMSSGYHTVSWNGKDDLGVTVPSGFYIYMLKAGERTSARKMFLAK